VRAPEEAELDAEQYSTVEQREHALRFGMWVFLASEITLFAGLFALYAGYRTMYSGEFVHAIERNTIVYGTLNTYLLITSSFTVALTVWAVRHARFRTVTALLLLTAAFGVVFLIIKGIEYAKHVREGIIPGLAYHNAEMPSYGARVFWTLYYVSTGLHALHVTAGVTVLLWMAVRAARRAYTPERHVWLEMGTLYWHLVDIMWIFLWPLLYLTH
jgi:cytochrome c oxidase subunit III